MMIMMMMLMMVIIRPPYHLHKKCGVSSISGARCSLVVRVFAHGAMGRHSGPIEPVLHDWYNKGRGMDCPICGMMPTQLKRIACVDEAAGFISLSDWSFTIWPTPYDRK